MWHCEKTTQKGKAVTTSLSRLILVRLSMFLSGTDCRLELRISLGLIDLLVDLWPVLGCLA